MHTFSICHDELLIFKNYWKKTEGSIIIVNFSYTVFSVKESGILDCQFGLHYYKHKPTYKGKKDTQTTRKIDCQACVDGKTFILYSAVCYF